MKLLYCGQSAPDEATFKRLLLIGTELVFMDRPSVTFGRWGTIGHQSLFRALNTTGEPVAVSVYAPPSGPAMTLYEPYAIADFENPEFVHTVLEGLRRDSAFASKFIQPQANYGDGLKGQRIIDAVGLAPDLVPLPLMAETDPRRLFMVDNVDDQRATLRTIMADASIQLTSALIVADEAQAVPVANDPYFSKLLSLRTSGPKYVGESALYAWLIGMEFATAVIPDEALQKMSINDIIAYRRKTADLHRAWTADLNQIAFKIDDFEPAQSRVPVGHNRGQRLQHLMSNRSRQFSGRTAAVHESELGKMLT
jgi:hypothetical protein